MRKFIFLLIFSFGFLGEANAKNKCDLYLQQETPNDAMKVLEALSIGGTPLKHKGKIVGVLLVDGTVVGCDPR